MKNITTRPLRIEVGPEELADKHDAAALREIRDWREEQLVWAIFANLPGSVVQHARALVGVARAALMLKGER